ncbi:MAG: hypothetical protein OHK0022_31840 [Roseiflexaceae bacterium]
MSFVRDPKRLVATFVAGVIGLLVLIDFSQSVPVIDMVARTLVGWAALLATIALLVGLLSVANSHFVRVLRRQSDWGYSLVLLLSMVLVIVIGIFISWTVNPVTGEFGYTFFPTLLEQSTRDVFNAVYQPLAASFLALLAFFSLSAGLRALQRRTTEAMVIIGVALIVLLVTALPQLAALPFVGEGVRWMNDVVALAGARGLLLGASVGALVAGVRVLLGFDQPYLDR